MARTYTRYECNICRRIIDKVTDDVRVIPNLCVITKGCAGQLVAVGTTLAPSSTPAVAGLDDWYARGTTKTTSTVASEPVEVCLANSDMGSLVAAVKRSTFTDANATLKINFNQKKSGNIAYQQYTYKSVGAVNSVSGKDSRGKYLRVTIEAGAQGRTSVKVDGVQLAYLTDYQITTDTISFTNTLSSGSHIVDVIVYTEQTVNQITLEFTKNSALPYASYPTAWNNVNSIHINDEEWVLYTSYDPGAAGVTANCQLQFVSATPTSGAGDLSIGGIYSNIAFVLSQPPRENIDRIKSLIIEAEKIRSSFVITVPTDLGNPMVSTTEAYATEVYPPLVVKLTDLNHADTNEYSSGKITDDNSDVVIPSSIIIGDIV